MSLRRIERPSGVGRETTRKYLKAGRIARIGTAAKLIDDLIKPRRVAALRCPSDLMVGSRAQSYGSPT